jgi:hypothetical protein
MHKLSATFAIATIGVVIGFLSTSALAQSQKPAGPRCPAGYWLMQSLCLNNATGDVVNAAPAGITTRVVSVQGCAPGYWRLEEVCLSDATGDVELADEKRWPAEQRAARRN